jgi:hypothetical protein
MKKMSCILFAIFLFASVNAQTVTYDFTTTNISADDCGGGCQCFLATDLGYFGSALQFSWTSTGGAVPTSVVLEVNELWNDAAGATPVLLNAVVDGSYTGSASCAGIVETLNLTPVNYNVGATNVIELDYNASFGSIDLTENLAWGPGVFARLTVVYPAANTAPTAVADNETVGSGSSGNIFDVQLNDSDPEGDVLVTSIIGGPSSGGSAITVNNDSISYTPPPGFCGADTIVYQVCDGEPLCDSDTIFITVADVVNPVAVCQNVSVYLDGTGIASIVVSDIDGGSTDNCSAISLSADITSFSCSDVGSPVAVTLTVTDAFTNSDNCVATVTVLDTVSPTLSSCPGDIAIGANASGCSAIVTWLAPTEADNCSGVILSGSHNSGDTFPIGTTTVTYTATDASGNTTTCSFDVTVSTAFTASATLVNVDCNGDSTGIAALFGTGNVGPITVDWGTLDPSQLPAGTFVYTVTDSIGCSIIDSVTITEGTAITLSATTTIETTPGNNGAIDLTIGGGTPSSGGYVIDWDNDGTGDNDDTEDLNSIVGGTYNVTVYDSLGCSNTLVVNVPTSVGMTEYENRFSVNVYPNPSSGQFYIEFKNGKDVSFEILNLLGEKVINIDNPDARTQVNIQNYPVGIYLVRIKDGSQVITKRIAVKK